MDEEFDKKNLEEKLKEINEGIKEVNGRLSELWGFLMGMQAAKGLKF